MTIQELAKELGVSKQAIYQRCKRNNVDIETLTETEQDGKKGLTPDGEMVIRGIYAQKRQFSTKKNLQVKENEVSKLKSVVNELTQTVNSQRDRIAELEKERDFLRQQLSKATDNIDRMAKSLDTLTAKQKQTGFMGWLRRLGAGKKAPDQDGGGAEE